MLQLVSQTAFTAIVPSDIRSHLNITDSSQDGYIQTLIDAAVLYCERETGLDFRSTTWNLVEGQYPIWANYSWMDRFGAYIYTYPLVSQMAVGRLSQSWQAVHLHRTIPHRELYHLLRYRQQSTDPCQRCLRIHNAKLFPWRG